MRRGISTYGKLYRLVYYLLVLVNISLLFRLVFKFFGANPGNRIIDFLYTCTGYLVRPFRDIFDVIVVRRGGYNMVIEPSALIAIVAYSIAAFALVRLFELLFSRH